MSHQEMCTLGISVIAICLSIFNFIITLRSNRRNQELQKRNDRIEVDNLLDSAFDLLYAKDGFSQTKEKKKFYDAQSKVLRAKEIDDNYSRVVEYEGMVLEAEGKVKRAIKKYKSALKLKPLRWNSYNLLGRLHEGEEAIQYFRQAIKISPDNAGLPLYNIGWRYKQMGNLKEAQLALGESLEYHPNYEYTHFEMGNLHAKEGRYKDARLSYEKAISINPRYIDAIVSLGAMMATEIDWDEGVSWIEQAMKINPTDGHPLAMMGALYADTKDPENALKYYEKAVEIDPKYRLSSGAMHELKIAMEKMQEEQKNA